MKPGDVVLPIAHVTKAQHDCPCGEAFLDVDFGPAIVVDISPRTGLIHVCRPFETHMVYVFRPEDLEVVCATNGE